MRAVYRTETEDPDSVRCASQAVDFPPRRPRGECRYPRRLRRGHTQSETAGIGARMRRRQAAGTERNHLSCRRTRRRVEALAVDRRGPTRKVLRRPAIASLLSARVTRRGMRRTRPRYNASGLPVHDKRALPTSGRATVRARPHSRRAKVRTERNPKQRVDARAPWRWRPITRLRTR